MRQYFQILMAGFLLAQQSGQVDAKISKASKIGLCLKALPNTSNMRLLRYNNKLQENPFELWGQIQYRCRNVDADGDVSESLALQFLNSQDVTANRAERAWAIRVNLFATIQVGEFLSITPLLMFEVIMARAPRLDGEVHHIMTQTHILFEECDQLSHIDAPYSSDEMTRVRKSVVSLVLTSGRLREDSTPAIARFLNKVRAQLSDVANDFLIPIISELLWRMEEERVHDVFVAEGLFLVFFDVCDLMQIQQSKIANAMFEVGHSQQGSRGYLEMCRWMLNAELTRAGVRMHILLTDNLQLLVDNPLSELLKVEEMLSLMRALNQSDQSDWLRRMDNVTASSVTESWEFLPQHMSHVVSKITTLIVEDSRHANDPMSANLLHNLTVSIHDSWSVEAYFEGIFVLFQLKEKGLHDVMDHLFSDDALIPKDEMTSLLVTYFISNMQRLYDQSVDEGGQEPVEYQWDVMVERIGALAGLFCRGYGSFIDFDVMRQFLAIVPSQFYGRIKLNIERASENKALAADFIQKITLPAEPLSPSASWLSIELSKKMAVLCVSYLAVGMGWLWWEKKTKAKTKTKASGFRKPNVEQRNQKNNVVENSKPKMDPGGALDKQLEQCNKTRDELLEVLKRLENGGIKIACRSKDGRYLHCLRCELQSPQKISNLTLDETKEFVSNISRLVLIAFKEDNVFRDKSSKWAEIKAIIENNKKDDIQGAQERLKSLIESNEKTLEQHDNNSDQISNLKAMISNHMRLKKSADFILGAFDDDLSPPSGFEDFLQPSTVKNMIQSLMSASQESPFEISTSGLPGPN